MCTHAGAKLQGESVSARSVPLAVKDQREGLIDQLIIFGCDAYHGGLLQECLRCLQTP